MLLTLLIIVTNILYRFIAGSTDHMTRYKPGINPYYHIDLCIISGKKQNAITSLKKSEKHPDNKPIITLKIE